MSTRAEFSREQRLFRDVVRGFLGKVSSAEAVREQMSSELGYDEAVWRRLCDEAALAGVHVPERYGGSGFGLVELCIVAEEMGRVLFCGPYLSSSVLATCTLLRAGSEEAKAGLLPGIAGGATLATVALEHLNGLSQLGGGALFLDRAGDLHGVADLVPDATVADVILVAARADDGLRLVSVDPGDEAVSLEHRQTMDATRRLARVTFRGARATARGELDESALDRLWDELGVFIAHECIGGARHLLESTVEYTKVRLQFGRPIGSFQALKHRCADLLMELELATAVTHHAARCLDAGEGEAWAPSLAKAMASEVYVECAKAGIQLRGGIGFTWENDTHLWYKRAKSSEVLFGAPHVHRERAIALMEKAS